MSASGSQCVKARSWKDFYQFEKSQTREKTKNVHCFMVLDKPGKALPCHTKCENRGNGI